MSVSVTEVKSNPMYWYTVLNASNMDKKLNIVLQKFIPFLLYYILRNYEDHGVCHRNMIEQQVDTENFPGLPQRDILASLFGTY